MKRAHQKSPLFRTLGAGLGLALAAAASLVAAAPAMALTATTYAVTGTVLAADGADAGLPLAGASITADDGSSAVTAADGTFSVSLADATSYVLSVAATGYTTATENVSVNGADVPLGDISLNTAAPATFSISGQVTASDSNADFAPTVTLDGVTDSSPELAQIDASGAFTFSNVAPNPDLTLEFAAPGYQSVVKAVPVSTADVTVTVQLLPNPPALTPGTVKISGTPVVGNVLTANTAGWPAGAVLTYQWGYSGGQFGGPIDGATGKTYTITSDQAGMMISVFVTATKAGFSPAIQSEFMTTPVTQPQKPAAAAPAGDTGGLAVYLKGRGVTAQPQTAAGLPSGDLNPGDDYTATLNWTAADSYVDVYLYSTPTLVGTFPIVNGKVQVQLSAEVLSELEAGNHTLVVTGQTSGSVQAVAVTVAAMLASTGVNAAAPLVVAALLLLLGGALLVIRRRRQHA